MTTLQNMQANTNGISIKFSPKQATRVFDALCASGLCPAYRERQISSNGGKSVSSIPVASIADAYERDAPFRSAIASIPGASAAFKRIASTRGTVDFGPLGDDGLYEMRPAPKRASANPQT